MNGMIVIGFLLGGGTIAFDRLIHKVPDLLAIVLYCAAIILIILGMLSIRKSDCRKTS